MLPDSRFSESATLYSPVDAQARISPASTGPAGVGRQAPRPFIYIACPWTHVGGGMFKVADYLIQGQALPAPAAGAELKPLDTRGSRGPLWSVWVSTTALARIVRARRQGQLRGVHVNMAERLSLIRKSLVLITCRLAGVPVILHLHAAQLHHFYRGAPAIVRALTRRMFSLPASIVVLGGGSRQFVVDELRVAPEKVEIVTNGVPRPTAERRADVAGRRRQLLFLGSDWQRKGLFDLLAALARLGAAPERLELVIAGRGPIEDCRRAARALGVERFLRFEGWADQQKASRLMAEADALVLPSYDEGLPLVILEALASGVAVVCSPVGEIPTVLTDGIDACFVTPGDVDDIARGLRQVLADDEFRIRLERQGRERYEQCFSMKHFFARIADIHRRHFGVAALPRGDEKP